MIKFNDRSHWYGRDGSANDDADLRVARKANLYPSVTNIDKAIFKNAFLEKWKLNQLVIAASENFRQPHEEAETYANRIYELSNEKADTAATFGKAVHAACDAWPLPCSNAAVLPFYEKFDLWAQANIEETFYSEEVLLDHDIGVAGRGDRCVLLKGYGRAMLDYKTQGVKVDDKGRKKPVFYPAWVRQLAFYAGCDSKKCGTWPALPTCVSIIINSVEPDDPFINVWSAGEVIEAYEDFVLGAYQFFKSRGKDGYWPVGRWTIQPSVQLPAKQL